MLKRSTLILFMLFLLQACSTVPTRESSHWSGYVQSGKASFYASKFQSRKTASGERFDQNRKTAAHKKLPFGSKVKVTNIANGKTVVVKINDRGPFVKGRIIDLSLSAFRQIGNPAQGVLKVKIEVIN
jgi:rare lipoprotein A